MNQYQQKDQQQQHQQKVSSNTAALAAHVAEKKRELEGFQELVSLSDNLVQQLTEYAVNADSLADGTEAIAAVLKNWSNVIRAVTLANSKITNLTQEDYDDVTEPPLPEILVRKRLD